MGGKQLGFSDYELTTAKKQTKREKFLSETVTARKDDAPAAVQAAFLNLAGLNSISVDGGLIQTTSG